MWESYIIKIYSWTSWMYKKRYSGLYINVNEEMTKRKFYCAYKVISLVFMCTYVHTGVCTYFGTGEYRGGWRAFNVVVHGKEFLKVMV